MKKNITFYSVLAFILVITGGSNCNGPDNEINYEIGTFPEETHNLDGLNSSYDDYNAALPVIGGDLPLMFSSSRTTQGTDFDIHTGIISFIFNQVDGEFTVNSEMITSSFFDFIKETVNSSNNEFGPYRYFNSHNGLEYFFYASESDHGDLDLNYLSYSPSITDIPTYFIGNGKVGVLNSSGDDAYITFNKDLSIAYLTSNRDGDFDIYELAIDTPDNLDTWLIQDPQAMTATDSINSDYDDKCPIIINNIMAFTSDRPGGMGGFDLYYSIFRDNKWSSPVNFGPSINSEYNEYRPVIGVAGNFSNNFIIFSSDRSDGHGGFDLYFSGFTFPEE
ncbi:MAG: hypothetical protein K8R35_11235 [Bacteroidales bacterium]|nr:hypothetical protein [Bacteroidales bacterium]